ncbi:intersectin-2 isoform X2 [Orussus abietinus]|uniref:intersectin-2 isoform X2 n=1 Tax=Orussus abietinus TaxID=222816 RepID=UPI0006250290|nr:intersectin-2 isoform X2 [Orussus abietinus]
MAVPQAMGAVDPWVIQPRERARYQEQFNSLKPVNGIVTGEQAKGFLLQSQLSPAILGQIWGLSDTNADGKMDLNEFSIACKLINLKLRGFEIPKTLPPSLVQSLKDIASGNTMNLMGAAVPPLANLNGYSSVHSSMGMVNVPTSLPSRPVGPNVSHNQPPMRPMPPTMTIPVGPGSTSSTTGAVPQRPAPPSSIGTTPPLVGPPPKPAPPSFPNSPVGAPTVPPSVRTQPTPPPGAQSIPQSITPIIPVQNMVSTVVAGGIPIQPLTAPVAPIVPLNTQPAPIAAFGMTQTAPMQAYQQPVMPGMMAPMQPVMSGLIQPMTATVPSLTSAAPMTCAGGIPPMASVPSLPGIVPVNGVQTPVSTNTPLSTTARPPSLDRMGSMDSQHSQISQQSMSSPQGVEWAVPHQTKLKYTLLFNTWDKARSGYLTGVQARNGMVHSQLPQKILAQIWSLADMDSDGRLSCDEFVLAMYLCDMAKSGEKIPTTLPLELIPPSFRRQRQGSVASISSQGASEVIDPLAGMPQSSFEDKRKENYEKGQAELERRRKALLEIQRKEQEERERKEREEAEKQEKIRLDQERRRQVEIEMQIQRQKEIEQEKEEQRKRVQEQREAARKEMERQRQLEWEKQKSQELQAQRQKEQDILLKLKAKNQTLTIELGTLNDKVKELSQKICDTRVGVSSVKSTIDGMRSTRDTQLQEMSALRNRLREQNQRLLNVTQEKARIEAKNKLNAAQDAAGQEAVKMAFANKQITLKQMKDKIADLQRQIDEKMTDIENNNGQLEDIKTQMKNLISDCKNLHITFNDKRTMVLELRSAGTTTNNYATSAWGDSGWNDTGSMDKDEWPIEDTSAPSTDADVPGVVKYRALYEFIARNQDEISFQPGDIILVPPVQNAEPGWMAGEIRGRTGWFPESYVEPVDTAGSDAKIANNAFIQQDSVEKRPLEEIAEVPENVSDAGSLGGEGPTVEPIIPTSGLGYVCNVRAIAIYQYRPVTQEHLSFAKGDIIDVTEQQEDWWYGESGGNKGWFPRSYVRVTSQEDKDVSAPANGLNEQYVALYPYSSNESGDLSFNQGEIILVTRKEGDWWTGIIGDRTGIFPSNYVELCEEPNKDALETTNVNEGSITSAPTSAEQSELQQTEVSDASNIIQRSPTIEKTKEQLEDERAAAEDKAELPDFAAMSTQQYTKGRGKKPEIVQVIAPYQATSSEQLDLQRGQLIMIRKKTESGWWEGELQARGRKRQIGWFPASYVKPLTSSSNRSTPISHRYQDSPTDPNVERVMALYPYQAQNEDELSFEKADVITVLAKEEASWWRGELNGVSGVFPSNYTSPMSTERNCDPTLTRIGSMERKRQEYIKELIVTEQAYIEDMRLVHEVFEKPLLASLVLTVDEVERIFINWRDIIACNDNFLRTLRIRRDNSEGGIVRMIGDILCENIPRMSAYVRFCSCQISAAAYLQRLTETSAEFVEVAHACQQDPRTKGMPLSSFLIKPMQRITKYPLMIGKILEHTPATHPDRQYLQEALAKAEEFCTQVNEGVREKENSDRLEWLQTHVACDGLEEQLVFNSLTNSLGPRKFLHYGILHKAKSGKELVGFLTNDFLLLAQPTKPLPSGQQFSFDRCDHYRFKMYRKPIFLNELILGESEHAAGSGTCSGSGNNNETADNALTIRIKESKKCIVLLALSTSECCLWTKRLTEARKTFLENEKNLLQRQRSKQAQFGACGRILVKVLEGSSLKTTSVRRRPPKGRLQLVVEGAEDLILVKQGKCNAFCKVSMGSQEERTGVVSGTDCPRWDSPMQFQVKDLQEDTLCITVFDKGYYSPDEFLGRAEIRVADINRDSKDACGPIQKRIKLHEVEKGDVVLKLDLRLFGSG